MHHAPRPMGEWESAGPLVQGSYPPGQVTVTNPWQANVIEKCRSFVRFALWLCIAVNGAMLAVFSIMFTHQFLRHTWSWCQRVLFPGEW